MSIRIVRLGVTPRLPDEGPRLGTVRRPPRGVRKEDYARLDYYDSWLPLLSPSAELMAQGKAADDDKAWAAFAKAYRKEMSEAAPSQVLDALAAMSRTANLSMGCYCEDPARCHRSLLTRLLEERGAELRVE
ncbi:DUF488 family protein [Mitsuaria sp. GD03876]|uniref:DUF488 domain-containing protein n=1 Tax=Mitsuaria sp. GD03876 TaxID=2975399 RepID=UPI0024481014|nr:DUF488 family protein [Mitsuaria sp. GD03876]MDH0864136.1 DUF488 family protein [Mitsuaria sp. GD03876]